ncbi:MAG: hypothetical protein ABH846_02275 [Patescibacteria group bacterium]
MPSDLEKTIFRTIAYFSYFSYPLTTFEIFKWQMNPERHYILLEITNAIQESAWLKSKLNHFRGFYSLVGAQIKDQVRTRHQRFINATTKYKKLDSILSYLIRLPNIEGVALCNTSVFHHTREHSDIDLFVITRPGRIWASRLVSVAPMKLLHQRPGEVQRNPVDISFFISSEQLNIEDLKIDSLDPYLAVWSRSLIPLFEHETGLFERFFQQNQWAAAYTPNTSSARRAFAKRFSAKTKFPRLPIPESWCERLQRRQFPQEIRRLENIDTRVVVSDQMLKFHINDRRAQIVRSLNEKMKVCERK